jgi:uncharacterized membrane protein YdjX (TVP38/TMEM64 family)
MADLDDRKSRMLIPVLVAGVIILLIVAGAGIAGGFFHDFDAGGWTHRIEQTIADWGPWGIAVSIGIMIAHSFIPFPAEFLAIANGMLFGALAGTAITWTGAMLGAILAFGLSRFLGRPFVEAVLARRHMAWLDSVSGDKAVQWIFFARFVPVIAFNLVNYAAGLTRISWWTFIWTTGLGILPMTILMVTMGASAHHLAWQWWLVLMAGGVVAWFILRRWLKAAK